jgi:hypothetical protein
MEALAPYIPPALLPLVASLRDQIPLVGVALVSLGAVYLGYLYTLGRKEAAVTFNVPIPPEIRANWNGKNWEDAQGEEKKVLEGQLRGVSLLWRAICYTSDGIFLIVENELTQLLTHTDME